MIFYFKPEEIIVIHDEICKVFKNRKGILNKGQLESLCEHIRNDDYYPEIHHKISHLFFGLIQFHVFTDANKRTALITVLRFIINNLSEFKELDIEKSALFLEQLALSVATGKTKDIELPDIFLRYFGK